MFANAVYQFSFVERATLALFVAGWLGIGYRTHHGARRPRQAAETYCLILLSPPPRTLYGSGT